VLGVDAVHSVTICVLCAKAFGRDKSQCGTYIPLTGEEVLERFWASGRTVWDAYFYKPYAFVMQASVDVSKLR
jgi:hypothetical protein